MMVVITKDREAAGETKVIVEEQAAQAGAKEIECKTIAEDAQRDLDEALPALDAAVKYYYYRYGKQSSSNERRTVLFGFSQRFQPKQKECW